MTEASERAGTLAASTGNFAALVADGTPTPGGGSVAAYTSQLAAALGTMVCNLTAGKPKFSTVESRILEIRAGLEKLSDKLASLIDEDAASFQQVMSAYKLPKASEPEIAARNAKINIALERAIAVPLQTMESSLELLKLIEELSRIGNPNALSDVATAAQLAKAAMKGAYYNVAINVGSLSNPEAGAQTSERARDMIDQSESFASRIDGTFMKGAA
ncbi:MAG TPA: cyclodeaminase/cyclohydrolase family protein [Blastocatellia bacterium]